MILSSIASTNLYAVGYNQDTLELQIQFRNGDVYSYQNVSPEIYQQMITGDAGRVFSTVIKPQRYAMPYTKLGNMPLV